MQTGTRALRVSNRYDDPFSWAPPRGMKFFVFSVGSSPTFATLLYIAENDPDLPPHLGPDDGLWIVDCYGAGGVWQCVLLIVVFSVVFLVTDSILVGISCAGNVLRVSKKINHPWGFWKMVGTGNNQSDPPSWWESCTRHGQRSCHSDLGCAPSLPREKKCPTRFLVFSV